MTDDGQFVRWLERHVGWLDDLHTWRVNRRLEREGSPVRRPSRGDTRRALAIARERGLLTDEGWKWDR